MGFRPTRASLLLGDNYKNGLKLAIINQLLQLITISMLGYSYLYVSGAMLMGSISYTSAAGLQMGFNFALASKWTFNIGVDDFSFELGVNFVAIYLIYVSDSLQKRIQNEQATEFTTDDIV